MFENDLLSGKSYVKMIQTNVLIGECYGERLDNPWKGKYAPYGEA